MLLRRGRQLERLQDVDIVVELTDKLRVATLRLKLPRPCKYTHERLSTHRRIHLRDFRTSGVQVVTDEVREAATAYALPCAVPPNDRLRQCATLIQQGLRAEAVHLAESPPNLLDLVAALGFARTPKGGWNCAGAPICPSPLLPPDRPGHATPGRLRAGRASDKALRRPSAAGVVPRAVDQAPGRDEANRQRRPVPFLGPRHPAFRARPLQGDSRRVCDGDARSGRGDDHAASTARGA